MPIVLIPTDRITDWESFHDVFAEALGFPAYYGRNMSAWDDCVTYADDPVAGMIAPDLVVAPGDVLTLQLGNVAEFADRCPEQYAVLVDHAAFVNCRRVDVGERPIVALSFSESSGQ